MLRVGVVLCLFFVAMPVSWADSSARKQDSAAQQVARLAAMPEVHAAFEWFRTHARDIAERQMEVTRIPAPPFGESHRAEWFRARFLELGLTEVHIDEAGNVLGVRPGTAPGCKFVAVMAHIDTVFPHGTPIDIHREGDRLAGPGISDNGAGMAALLAVISALQAANIRNGSPILFIANVGEEGEGDLRGTRHVFEDPRWRQAIGSTLVIDGGGTDTLVTEGLGSRRFLATVRAPGGHSWSDFGTPNPIVLLARAIDAFSRTPIPSDPRSAFNIGVISGGTSVNSIPESASMKVDIRSSSPAELDRLEKALRDALAQATADVHTGGPAKRDGAEVSYTVKLIGDRPAAELPANARILQVLKAVDAQLGINSRQQRASTDANIPLSLGREAMAIGGGGIGGGAHTLHEWYDPTNRDVGLRRILLAVLALSGVQ
ncbi:MAG: M20/M25/M40 family metallo-hydrolase [Terriglobales bacterium]